jgi:hypothetical protein
MQTPDQLRRWQTPISSADSVVLKSLTDEGHLNLTFHASFSDESNLVCFQFMHPSSYMVQERASLPTAQLKTDMGRTFIRRQIKKSQETLFNYSAMKKALGDEHACSLGSCNNDDDHYYFLNEKSLIEVCCSRPPQTLLIAKQSRANDRKLAS